MKSFILKKLLLTAALVLCFSALIAIISSNQIKNSRYEKVVEVIDGDTFKVSTGQKVRLIGVDTPELHHPKKPVQCYGKEAMIITKRLIEGRTVRLEKDVSETDQYGRLLRYVYVPDQYLGSFKRGSEILLNAYLVQEGYARLETFPPDVDKAELFKQLQSEAVINRKGLWKWCH